jgi:hypothetical protein
MARRMSDLLEVFSRHPGLTERSLRARGVARSAPWLLGAGAVAEAIYFAGTLAAEHVLRGKSSVLPSLVCFALGYLAGAMIVSQSDHPLEHLRWGAFANGLALTVAAGVVGTLFFGFGAAVVSLPAGLVIGLVLVLATDKARIEEAARAHRMRSQLSSG